MSDLNKTDRILHLLQAISKTPRKRLSEDQVREILGKPSKASFYRLVGELIQDRGELKAVLVKAKEEDTIYYSLNTKAWLQFVESEKETHFILDCLRHIGPYFNSLSESLGVFDGLAKEKKNLDQRFIYLSKVQGQSLSIQHQKWLQSIVKSILASSKLIISYNEKTYEFIPLSICQHRDELYLIGTKENFAPEEIRTLKISRIQSLFESNHSFKYPTLSKYNPHELYKNTSGLIRGIEITAIIKVFNHSRKILKEKSFFASKLVTCDTESETYECTYTNVEEFLGQLFVYAQDLEILSPSELKDAFIKKAHAAIEQNSKVILKKAS